jgi:hypothetical protein
MYLVSMEVPETVHEGSDMGTNVRVDISAQRRNVTDAEWLVLTKMVKI